MCYGLETVFVLYTGHVIVMPVLTFLANTFIPDEYNYTITISSTSLIVFIIVDQLLCACTLFWTPMGPVEKMPTSRIWQSVWYGFLNCKTYYLVLFPLVYDTKIALIPWMVDWMFGFSNLITTWTMVYWNVLFYHAHRIGHLPIVYSDAHRFHHYLRDATSFEWVCCERLQWFSCMVYSNNFSQRLFLRRWWWGFKSTKEAIVDNVWNWLFWAGQVDFCSNKPTKTKQIKEELYD